MNQQNENQTIIPIRKLLFILGNSIKKLWAVVILLTILGSAAMGAYSWYNYTPYYTASATFTVYVKNESQSEMAVYNFAAAEQMAKTFPYVLTSGVLSDLVKEDMGVSALPSISASAVKDANLFVLKVGGTDANNCYNVLKSVIKNYPQVAELVIGPTEMIVIDESGVPTEPVNARLWQNSAKRGALIGFAVSMAIVAVYGFTKATILGREDLERVANARYMGALPSINMKKRSKNINKYIGFDGTNDKGYRDSFRAITIRVDKYMRDKHYHTLMVCSAASGEGKTTIVYNLAHMLVKINRKVIILDCDLRNPSMYKMLEIAKCPGVAELISEEADIAGVKHSLIPQKLDIIFAGEDAADATEILATPRFEEIIRELRKEYDYVIIDTPPCSLLSDAEDMAQLADGALMVVRQNYASRASVLDGIVRLNQVGVPVIGYILNICKTELSSGYGYGYGFSYGYNYGYGYGYGDRDKEE